jgi:hypothetical protein
VTYVRINSQGLRDREHAIQKPQDTIRIAVIGDSFAEAFQVPRENAFWAVMEQRLSGCEAPSVMNTGQAGTNVEVLNFGVSGFSTARELILLRRSVWQYSPSVVVLLFTTRNDVSDNSRTLNQYPGLPLPYFIDRGGSLALDDSLVQARNRSLAFRLQRSVVGQSVDWLRDHLRLLGLIDAARETYHGRNRAVEKKKSVDTELGLDGEVLRAPLNADWDEAWSVTERLIVQMRDEVKAKGAQFLVVTGSSGIQVSPDASMRAAFMNRLGVQTLFYPDLRIKALGEREGFDVLTLAPPLLEYATRNRIFLHGSGEAERTGHWNETGHRVVGGLIAEQLCGFMRNGSS